jgi:hypothetical protein
MSVSFLQHAKSLAASVRTASSWRLLPWLCLAFVIVMIIWASRIGFDFTDEGYYYLNAKFWQDYGSLFTQFGIVAHGLLEAAGGQIWVMRVLTVFLHFGAGWVLWHGASSWRQQSWLDWLPTLLLWTLAGFVWLPVSLSYNSLNGLAATAWTGIWLGQQARPAWWKLVLLLLLSGLSFCGKPTTGLCLLALSITALLPRPAATWLIKAIAWGTVAIMVAGLTGALSWLTSAITASAADTPVAIAITGAISILLHTGSAAASALKQALPFAVIPLAVMCGWRLAARSTIEEAGSQVTWAAALAAALVSSAWMAVHQAPVHNAHFMFFGASAAGLVLLSFMVAMWLVPSPVNQRSGPASEILVLLLIPFLGWLGTHNPLETNALFQASPWVLLILVMSDRLPGFSSQVMNVTLCMFVTAMLWLGIVEYPYRLAKPLYEQEKPTKIDDSDNVLLMDGRSSSLINQTRTLLKDAGFKRNDPVLAFYHLPGLVYAVGGRSPGLSWYSSFSGVHAGTGIDVASRNHQAILDLPETELRRSYILQSPGAKDFIASLQQRGIRFPDDYQLLGKVPLPGQMNVGELTVWKPVTAP